MAHPAPSGQVASGCGWHRMAVIMQPQSVEATTLQGAHSLRPTVQGWGLRPADLVGKDPTHQLCLWPWVARSPGSVGTEW